MSPGSKSNEVSQTSACQLSALSVGHIKLSMCLPPFIGHVSVSIAQCFIQSAACYCHVYSGGVIKLSAILHELALQFSLKQKRWYY